MNYRIVWSSRARRTIQTLVFLAWEKGADSTFLDEPIQAITDLLSRQPRTAGESRGDEERIVFAGVLSVVYEIFESERVVLIYRANVSHG